MILQKADRSIRNRESDYIPIAKIYYYGYTVIDIPSLLWIKSFEKQSVINV